MVIMEVLWSYEPKMKVELSIVRCKIGQIETWEPVDSNMSKNKDDRRCAGLAYCVSARAPCHSCVGVAPVA
jgi:hypothetical protein